MSFLLAVMTIVYFFCPGMPLLMIFFVVFVLMFYWIEKHMILRFYKKPINLDDTVMKLSNYAVIAIILVHMINAIQMFGTSSVFPVDTKYESGRRRGYPTSYYVPDDINVIEKFFLPPECVVILLAIAFILVVLFLIFLFRNKILCQKFKFFPMKFSAKMRYIPPTYTNMKLKGVVLGETTYRIADLPKYKE